MCQNVKTTTSVTIIPLVRLFVLPFLEMIISEGYLIRASTEQEIQKFTYNLSTLIEFVGRLIHVVPPANHRSSFAAERVVRLTKISPKSTLALAVKYLNLLRCCRQQKGSKQASSCSLGPPTVIEEGRRAYCATIFRVYWFNNKFSFWLNLKNVFLLNCAPLRKRDGAASLVVIF